MLVNTAHILVHKNTKAPWMSQRAEFEALVLLYCCCTAAAVTVAARLRLESRGSVGLYSPAPFGSVHAPHAPLFMRCSWDYVFVS